MLDCSLGKLEIIREFYQLVRVRDKKLSYRRGIARCIVSVEILPIAMQQCRNYL